MSSLGDSRIEWLRFSYGVQQGSWELPSTLQTDSWRTFLHNVTDLPIFEGIWQFWEVLMPFVSSDHTPTYKHPELRGQSIEFDEVGLYGELK